ncbi:redox-regulated ATPase YchF [candidate division WOR-3 bacterium]|uniref:Redox-regulated ATPase YchF n=1 Tax=candidate division WOR-3 bacterium TaxID=2052148 RepID=A0A937XFP1_UNCW3|nr:redox-regulated ATPase YchF [candidate division WOR-3 bacterium]
MKVGIVGLPNVGKSSLFNLLTRGSARVDLYPFTTIEQNVGVVLVPDERLDRIAQILRPEKATPAHVEFVDIAGLVKGASAGEGLGNKFLGHIREADLILHIVRAFSAGNIPHVLDTVDPDRDAGIVEAELAIADLAIVEKRLEHVRKEPKSPEHQLLLEALEKLHSALARGERPVLNPEQARAVRELGLIQIKPVIYAVNCSDTEPANPARFAATAARTSLLFSAALESGMCDFTEPERIEMRKSLNLAPEGPAGIVTRCFDALRLIRFYTIKGTESRAWAAPAGTTALEAAFMIHTDIGSGFVKAEVVNYRDLVTSGDFHVCRDKGHVKVEGRTYVVQDGDVLLIKFR